MARHGLRVDPLWRWWRPAPEVLVVLVLGLAITAFGLGWYHHNAARARSVAATGRCTVATVIETRHSLRLTWGTVRYAVDSAEHTARLYGTASFAVGQLVRICSTDAGWDAVSTADGESSRWLRSDDPPAYPTAVGCIAILLGGGVHLRRRKGC